MKVRAKKLPKPVRIAALVAIAFFGLWSARLVWWGYHAKPGGGVDYGQQAEDLASGYRQKDPRGDGEAGDGYTHLVALSSRYQTIRDRFDVAARQGQRTQPEGWPYGVGWPTADFTVLVHPELAEGVKAPTRALFEFLANDGLFAELDELASEAGIRPSQGQTDLALLSTTGLSKPARAVALNLGRMCVAHARGDEAEFLRAFESSLAIGRIMASQPTIIERCSGQGAVLWAIEEAATCLTEKPPSEAALLGLLAAMDRQLPLPPIELALEGERLACLDTIQWTHSDDGDGRGYVLVATIDRLSLFGGPQPPPQAGSVWSNVMGRLRFPEKRHTVAEANRLFDAALKASASPRGADEMDALVNALPMNQLILRMLLPAIWTGLRSETHTDVMIAGLRTVIAVELHKARTGAYPASLAVLAPGELPRDPVATDGAFRYVVPPPDESDSRGYLLYSVGLDATDNGAREQPRKPADALSKKEAAGFDYTINRPRKKIEP